MQISHRCTSPRVAAKSTTPNNFQNLAGLHQAITWTSVDLSSIGFSGTHLGQDQTFMIGLRCTYITNFFYFPVTDSDRASHPTVNPERGPEQRMPHQRVETQILPRHQWAHQDTQLSRPYGKYRAQNFCLHDLQNFTCFKTLTTWQGTRIVAPTTAAGQHAIFLANFLVYDFVSLDPGL